MRFSYSVGSKGTDLGVRRMKCMVLNTRWFTLGTEHALETLSYIKYRTYILLEDSGTGFCQPVVLID